MVQVNNGTTKNVKSIKVTDLGILVTYTKDAHNEYIDRFIPVSEYGSMEGIIREFVERVLSR